MRRRPRGDSRYLRERTGQSVPKDFPVGSYYGEFPDVLGLAVLPRSATGSRYSLRGWICCQTGLPQVCSECKTVLHVIVQCPSVVELWDNVE